MFRKIACLVVTCSILFSCQQEPANSTETTKASEATNSTKTAAIKVQTSDKSKELEMIKKSQPPQDKMKSVSFIATVKFMNLEGGFFGLVSKEGKHLLPTNLKKEFHQHGAVIKVSGNMLPNMITIEQWGTPFKITDIELIKAGSKGTDSSLL